MKKRILAVVGIAVALVIGLTGCDSRSQCEIDGGVQVFSHYLPITQMVPNGNGGFVYTQQLYPQYTCNMEGEQ